MEPAAPVSRAFCHVPALQESLHWSWDGLNASPTLTELPGEWALRSELGQAGLQRFVLCNLCFLNPMVRRDGRLHGLWVAKNRHDLLYTHTLFLYLAKISECFK